MASAPKRKAAKKSAAIKSRPKVKRAAAPMIVLDNTGRNEGAPRPKEKKPVDIVQSVAQSLRRPRPVKAVTVSKLDDMAWLLENDPNALNLVSRQDLLHAIDPTLAKTTRFMPLNATNADLWMVRFGDPLVSVNAAFELLALVEKDITWNMSYGGTLYNIMVLSPVIVEATAPSLAAAISAAALYLQTAKDNAK